MTGIEDFKAGQFAEKTITVTEELVRDFARATGDYNPIHVDEEYAAKSFFRGRVAHGLLSGSFIGAMLGTVLPGPGTIYVYQNFRFRAPVFIGETVTVRVEISDVNRGSGVVSLKTTVGVDGKTVIDGEAGILFRPAEEPSP
ncbi:MAG: MaoC family dehydratase [Deltaproteobacteria bacterium]|jgi:3-hydroxybutyryl-CoA dehydratase|nr:MaoC family dehydratase [Deltaproteobacteria bacterium]